MAVRRVEVAVAALCGGAALRGRRPARDAGRCTETRPAGSRAQASSRSRVVSEEPEQQEAVGGDALVDTGAGCRA